MVAKAAEESDVCFFRVEVSLSLFLVQGVSELTQFLVSFLSEPVGSSGPKFPTVDKSRGFEAKVNESFTLLCPAQGFPVPAFR